MIYIPITNIDDITNETLQVAALFKLLNAFHVF